VKIFPCFGKVDSEKESIGRFLGKGVRAEKMGEIMLNIWGTGEKCLREKIGKIDQVGESR